ncbi:unnamed protein product [Paramecium sonneborni]|uniref:Uncharacterized protein n=1 Tax=Paramecium sonneborni TaxID=65129 RepID=A0A8S1PE95_9CILI|nr:unnamed protein product [Paramecium sonneborni]
MEDQQKKLNNELIKIALLSKFKIQRLNLINKYRSLNYKIINKFITQPYLIKRRLIWMKLKVKIID